MYIVIIISLPATTASPERGPPLVCPSAPVLSDTGDSAQTPRQDGADVIGSVSSGWGPVANKRQLTSDGMGAGTGGTKSSADTEEERQAVKKSRGKGRMAARKKQQKTTSQVSPMALSSSVSSTS
jgi:hypothetical protein